MAALGQNASYLITIQQNGSGLTVQANAQAKLTLKIDNRWVNILEAIGISGDSGVVGSALANAANLGQIFSGNNFLPNFLTSHVWRGSNGLDINLSLRFDAWDNPANDVLAPVENLIQMYSPMRGTGDSIGTSIIGSLFMMPPGPTPLEYWNSGNSARGMITIAVGKLMIITGLVPTTLDWEFENRFETSGYPVAANVNVGLMSYTIPDQTEILSYFKLAAGVQPSAGAT